MNTTKHTHKIKVSLNKINDKRIKNVNALLGSFHRKFHCKSTYLLCTLVLDDQQYTAVHLGIHIMEQKYTQIWISQNNQNAKRKKKIK